MADEKKPLPHIQYRLIAQKAYEEDHDQDAPCMDHVESVIHNKAEADRIVKFLRESGYKVKLVRITKTYLIDELFPEDEAEGQEPGDAAGGEQHP